MNNNEELILQIAEEMAWDCHNDRDSDSYTKLCTQIVPAARIAVKYMAEQFKSAWIIAGIAYVGWEDDCHAEMVNRGLIPEAGNTDKKINTMADTIAEVAAIQAYDEEMYRKTGKTYLQRIKDEQESGKEAAGDESKNS
ncbi:hypothetical protein ACTJJB_01805 [Chitinophaga sp. 22536]|uniref:hypothetical protein n=1 Tax=unclassified Chitinophaga TaxID=2619133 RepID=UPI003F833153